MKVVVLSGEKKINICVCIFATHYYLLLSSCCASAIAHSRGNRADSILLCKNSPKLHSCGESGSNMVPIYTKCKIVYINKI